jgi:hypothetical protein
MAWPTSLVQTGDLITAGQLNQLPIAIAEASGAAASYDFQSIPALWTHLLIVADIRSSSPTSFGDLLVRLNNDSGSTYIRGRIEESGGTPASTGGAAVSAMWGGGTADEGAQIIWIPNYAAVVAKHALVAVSAAVKGFSTLNDQLFRACAGSWRPAVAAAINRVTLLPASGTIASDSIATLYGMGSI